MIEHWNDRVRKKRNCSLRNFENPLCCPGDVLDVGEKEKKPNDRTGKKRKREKDVLLT